MRKKIQLTLVNVWSIPNATPHFGLLCLAAYLREKCPELDINIAEGLNLLPKLSNLNSDIFGFTSDTLTFTKTLELAKKLRQKTNTPFIIGGVHITAMPKSFDPVFSAGIIGEGEETVLELLQIFLKEASLPKKYLEQVKGIVFLGDERKMIFTDKRDLIKNIDILPYPARDLTPMKELYLKNQLNLFGVRKLVSIMTSRGCPYHCIFCGSPIQWGKVRFHSANHVVNEIISLVEEYDIDGIMFWDDLFIAPKKRLQEIVQLIHEKKLHEKIIFFGYARANLIDNEVCSLLASINVKRLIFGLESASERILSYLKGNSVTVADNERALNLCRKYKITTSSGFITGVPGETIDDLKKTFNFIKKQPLDNTQIYILTPYPGTQIWKIAEEKQIVSSKMDFGKLFVQLPAISFFDLFKNHFPGLLKGRIFLNPGEVSNKEYVDMIYHIHKFAYIKNLFFYIKTVSCDFRLFIQIFKSQLTSLIKLFPWKKEF